MRISDWSSDVCSSDLLAADVEFEVAVGVGLQLMTEQVRLGNVAERFVQARNVGARLRLRARPLHGEVQKARRALVAGNPVDRIAVAPGLQIREDGRDAAEFERRSAELVK